VVSFGYCCLQDIFSFNLSERDLWHSYSIIRFQILGVGKKEGNTFLLICVNISVTLSLLVFALVE